MADKTNDDLDMHELLGWTEFCCWSALVMIPLIYWLQGPSVSTDQFTIRTAMIVVAAIGGVSFRTGALIRWLRSRTRRRATETPDPPSQTE
jgi:hypothetical protein